MAASHRDEVSPPAPRSRHASDPRHFVPRQRQVRATQENTMAPYDRRRAEEAFEAARVERARMITRALAHTFETLARFFREMSTRELPPSGEVSSMSAA
jgi:hypothetical protein